MPGVSCWFGRSKDSTQEIDGAVCFGASGQCGHTHRLLAGFASRSQQRLRIWIVALASNPRKLLTRRLRVRTSSRSRDDKPHFCRSQSRRISNGPIARRFAPVFVGIWTNWIGKGNEAAHLISARPPRLTVTPSTGCGHSLPGLEPCLREGKSYAGLRNGSPNHTARRIPHEAKLGRPCPALCK